MTTIGCEDTSEFLKQTASTLLSDPPAEGAGPQEPAEGPAGPQAEADQLADGNAEADSRGPVLQVYGESAIARASLIKLHTESCDRACTLREAAKYLESMSLDPVASKYLDAIRNAADGRSSDFAKAIHRIREVANVNWILISGTDGRKRNTVKVDHAAFLADTEQQRDYP